MPELESRRRPSLVRLAPPSWLRGAVSPWQINVAALWRSGGLMLELRSERATIPVIVELGDLGSLPRISILDASISAQRGASFVRALAGALARTPMLRAYLERLAALAERLAEDGDDSDTGALIDCWRVWPERDADPARELPALPPALARLQLDRPARASLVLYDFARGGAGDMIAALTNWAALGPLPAAPSFVELIVEAVALGVLGRRQQALDVLARAQSIAVGGPEHLAVARACEALDDRTAAVAAHRQVIAARGTAWDHLRLARAQGDFDGELPRLGTDTPARDKASPGRHGSADPSEARGGGGGDAREQISYARQLIKVLDAAGRYDDTLALVGALLDELIAAGTTPSELPRDLILRAATLHLWRVEGQQARARLALLGALAVLERDEHAGLILGALAVLDGDPQAALVQLAASSGESTRLERLLWTAEAQLALGQHEAALACVDEHIMLENSLVAYLLKLLIYARTKSRAELADSLASRTFLDALVPDVLPTLTDPERLAAAKAEPGSLAALVRELLDDMGGNLGPKPTWCRIVPGRSPLARGKLERVIVRPSGRDAAVANLVRIRTEPPDAVLDGFAAVVDAYPKSPHPWTYRGELLIWLGRYDDALASFAQADARAPTRWSYVGRAAAHDLLEQAEQADHWTREGTQRFGELVTATTHVYRGERLRKLGDWPAAQRDLETAVAFKTRRIGARINLALVYHAQGDTAAWQRECDRLRDDAPALLWEAGVRPDRAPDPELLLRVLELMVGNRSSFLHTMIDAQGQFRVIPEPRRWIAFARLCLAVARGPIEDELARRWC